MSDRRNLVPSPALVELALQLDALGPATRTTLLAALRLRVASDVVDQLSRTRR